MPRTPILVTAALVAGFVGGAVAVTALQDKPQPAPTATAAPGPQASATDLATVTASPTPSTAPTPDEAGLASAAQEWPGPDTTGPVDEDALVPSDSITTTQDGQVIEDVEVTGSIEVHHDDVTIRNVVVNGTGTYGIHVPHSLHEDVSALVIEDTRIVGVSGPRSSGLVHYGSWTARRMDISGYHDGVKMGEAQTLEDSWIHGLFHEPGAHNDGIQVQGGSGGVIRGNNIVNEHGQTSAILIQTNFGPIEDYVIEGNRLSGGGYTLYIQDKGNGHAPPRDVTVRNNLWVQDSWAFGPLRITDAPGLTWEGNIFDDGTSFNYEDGSTSE